MLLAIQERDVPDSEGGNIIRHDACDNVRILIREAIRALAAPVPGSPEGK
jgi:hypothetical protein